DFAAASSKLNVLIASINSLLLLTSSLTVTLAIYACRAGDHRRMAWCLGLTAALGIGFLAFKSVEYTQDYHEGLIPGPNFNFKEFKEIENELAEQGKSVSYPRVQLFFMFYYVMTGLHVIHMLVGIGIILYL